MSEVSTEVVAPVVAPAKKRAAKKKVAKKKAAPKTDADRSKQVAKTWKDPKVAKARSTRHKVKADGKEFSSVITAFAALRLPPGQAISFRLKLKKAGKLTFETDTGRKVAFAIVKD